MDNWPRLAASESKREQTHVPSQSVIGEKSLATELQWTIGERLAASGVKAKQTLVPSQSAIGEIKMARTVRTKALLTDAVCGSPGSV